MTREVRHLALAFGLLAGAQFPTPAEAGFHCSTFMGSTTCHGTGSDTGSVFTQSRTPFGSMGTFNRPGEPAENWSHTDFDASPYHPYAAPED